MFNSGEATNTNFTVFGLTRSRLKPMIYRTQGEHANHYSTNVVLELVAQCNTISAKFGLIMFIGFRKDIYVKSKRNG
jgi:hypothetical protein